MTRVKNAIFGMAFAFATMFAVAGFSLDSAQASDDWYIVTNPSGGHVALFDGAGGRPAKLWCKPQHGEYLHGTGREANGWIEVKWRKRFGAFEWNYKDHDGRWCGDWHRRGWAWNGWLRKIPKPHGNFLP